MVSSQERVFRMVEQLAAPGIGRVAAFAALRRADALVDAAGRGRPQIDRRALRLYFEGRAIGWEDLRPSPWSAILAAADAGCAVIDRLMGEHGTVVSLLRPEAFEERLGRDGRRWFPQAQAGRVMIVIEPPSSITCARVVSIPSPSMGPIQPGLPGPSMSLHAEPKRLSPNSAVTAIPASRRCRSESLSTGRLAARSLRGG